MNRPPFMAWKGRQSSCEGVVVGMAMILKMSPGTTGPSEGGTAQVVADPRATVAAAMAAVVYFMLRCVFGGLMGG